MGEITYSDGTNEPFPDEDEFKKLTEQLEAEYAAAKAFAGFDSLRSLMEQGLLGN